MACNLYLYACLSRSFISLGDSVFFFDLPYSRESYIMLHQMCAILRDRIASGAIKFAWICKNPPCLDYAINELSLWSQQNNKNRILTIEWFFSLIFFHSIATTSYWTRVSSLCSVWLRQNSENARFLINEIFSCLLMPHYINLSAIFQTLTVFHIYCFIWQECPYPRLIHLQLICDTN